MSNSAPYRTHSGVMLDLTNPRPEQIVLDDVAHHLARVCRFGGAVDQYYSVASHSVYVSRNLPSAFARAGLLHDATEAFIGDVVSGLKRLLPTYRDLEGVWAGCIEARFDVRFRHCPVVKDADLRARLSECRDLFVGYPRELLLGGEGDRQPYAEVCRTLPPEEAAWEFLAEAQKLGIE